SGTYRNKKNSNCFISAISNRCHPERTPPLRERGDLSEPPRAVDAGECNKPADRSSATLSTWASGFEAFLRVPSCPSWFKSHAASLHSGNGLRGEFLNATISSLTRARRRISSQTSFSSSSHSPPYHSGGISSAVCHITSSCISSTRDSHGSNCSHPRTVA